MKRIRCWLVIAVLMPALAPHLRAQGYAVVQQADVSVASKLAGRAVGGIDNVPVADARVELCSSGWKTILRSAKTDKNGNFSFDGGSNGELFYLRLSAPGFDPYELRVRIDTHVKSKLVIHLVIAT